MTALLILASVFALCATFVAYKAIRFRQGRAEHLRHQPWEMSLWPAARRNIPYGLLPIAGLLYLTSASMFAQVAGVRGAAVSAIYLALVLILLVLTVVLMVKRPRRLDPHRDAVVAPPAADDDDQVEQPPRPIREMTGQELAEWAKGDPEKLRRLLRRYR